MASAAEEGLTLAAQLSAERAGADALQIEAGAHHADVEVVRHADAGAVSSRSSTLLAQGVAADALQIEAGADAGAVSNRSSTLLAQGVEALWNALQGIAADAGTGALCDLRELGGPEAARFQALAAHPPERRHLLGGADVAAEHEWVTAVRRTAEGVRGQVQKT